MFTASYTLNMFTLIINTGVAIHPLLHGLQQGRRKQFGFGTAKWDMSTAAEGSV